MTVTISIKGLKEVQNKLSSYSKKQVENIDMSVTTATFFLRDEVVESINGNRAEPRSVLTGRFKSSISTEKIGLMEGEVSTEVEYAQHLEYGTSRISARGHFKNSAIRNEEKIKDFVKEAVSKEEL